MLVYHILLISGIAISGSSGYEVCQTPSGRQRSCVNLKRCAPLMRLLRTSVALPRSDVANLKTLQCGVDKLIPKVCCPTQTEVCVFAVKPTTTRRKDVSVAPSLPDVRNHRNLRLLKRDICGIATGDRIVGGNTTTPFEFPWMALLGYEVDRTEYISFECGGTVITDRYVLTAAHCVTRVPPGLELASVRLGEHDLDAEVDCEYDREGKAACADEYQDFSIERVHVHEGYRGTNEGRDIALIRLDRDVDFTRNNVKPICLPIGNAAEMPTGKTIVTGWGLDDDGKKSRALQQAKLSIVPNDECTESYQKVNKWAKILDDQICAGSERGVDSCKGDSGGPLQSPSAFHQVPQYFQYGIVSFGLDDCGTEGVPGVYTKVAYYVDWILDNISE